MKLYLKNIGKIEEAFIEMNGITVIAGENDTGKSTVGRALFAVFNGFTNIQTQIDKEREDSIALLMIRMAFSANLTPSELTGMNKLARDIVVEADQYKENNEKLERRLWDFLIRQIGDKIRNFDDTLIQETVGRIIDILNIKNEDFVNTVLGKRLKAEFYGQVCNVFSETPGSVSLKIKNSGIMVTVTPNGEVQVQNPNMLSLHTEIVYLDDPFILDDSKQFSYIYDPAYLNHRDHLRRKFFITERRGNLADEIIAKEKLERIYEKIASVCSGAIVKEKTSEIGYRVGRSDKVLNVRNLSTGLKTFVILKTLLMNGTIEQNGTIILDEPEIHLHPEWQLLFAELIVLIQKEFGVHVLLNTHSPYFLNAIEVYTAKYGIAEKCKYYLASLNGNSSVIKDVSEHMEEIYSKLARPLQVLENERGNL